MRKRKEQNAEKRAAILAIGDRQCAVGGGGSTELRRAVGRASMLLLLLLCCYSEMYKDFGELHGKGS